MKRRVRFAHCLCLIGLIGAGLLPVSVLAGWDNRYPKVDDFSHHVYLEQHEFPFLSSGPVDPALYGGVVGVLASPTAVAA